MDAIDLQKLLLESIPTRRELMSYIPTASKIIRVGVYRNHSFELVEHTIGAFLDFGGLQAQFEYSDYDDSLSFVHVDFSVDVLLLWLDLSRYKKIDIQSFLQQRIDALKTIFKKPIIFIGVCGEVSLHGVLSMPVVDIEKTLGDDFLDDRLAEVKGTRLSAKALVIISKLLGLVYLPAVTVPALKAIVVDLDNTLYSGVLGEDGINGLVLSEGHKLLQSLLLRKASEGLFLCALSKNNAQDVDLLWDKRSDFPLKKTDFTFIVASWDEKAKGMMSLLKQLNIGSESVLFIDDNVGELSAMQMAFPKMHILHALNDAEKTAEILSFYPGLLKTDVKKEDLIRRNDTIANEERAFLQNSLSKADYIRSLQIKIVYCVDIKETAERVAELANKTNQFIFSYRRYSSAEILDMMNDPDAVVVAATLSDRLSDSGIIAVCTGRRVDDAICLEECFVSCRALGRGIDDILVLEMIRLAAETLGTNRLQIVFKNGERNYPAQEFVKNHLGEYVEKSKEISFVTDKSLVKIEKRSE